MDDSGVGYGHDELPSTDTPLAIAKEWSADEALTDDPIIMEVLAWGAEMAAILGMQPNPYRWQVRPDNQIPLHHVTHALHPGVSEALANFGRPTTETVKLYTDLGARVAFDLKGTNQLSDETERDLLLMLDASRPLNFKDNIALGSPWSEADNSYGGSKKDIALYGHLRTQMSKSLKAVPIFMAQPPGHTNLNDVLKQWNCGKSFEIHHVNYKAIHPELVTELENLMLTQRSVRESTDGPGQHELMHLVASGLSKNKFNVLAPQVHRNLH